MIRKYYDKILLGIALALLVAFFVLVALQPAPKSTGEFVDITALRSENTFEVTPMPKLDLAVEEWEAPGAQSAGVEWVFDLFTPPVIYFSPRNKSFTVLPVTAPPPPPWPIELVTVREELYRIQLRGWLGDKGNYRISLENREGGGLLLAREGQEYKDLDFVVRSFRVEQSSRGSTSVGRAVIYDERLDREVTLHSEERTRSDESTAFFAPTNSSEADSEEFRAGEGESFTYGGFTYTVDEITPPARARVTRSGGGEEPETKTFVATKPEGGAPSEGEEAETSERSTSSESDVDPDF